MKIMKWKDAVEEFGTFLYTEKEYKDSDEWSRSVRISYETPSNRLCTERFPTTTPESYYKGDYDVYQDNIERYERGESNAIVSYMETTGDVLDTGEDEALIIVYDSADIDVWISKLNFLKR